MTELLKAKLGELGATPNASETPTNVVDVQFNPATLRVQISNRTAGGQQAGAQARQRPGTGEMQVSFDLVFDTADEGQTGSPVSVLDKTKMVERFVRPRGNRPGEEAPPRVQFEWGGFIVQGTMDSANIDLDLFDASGTPLRAKVAVTIKGQDPRWTYTPAPAASSGSGQGSTASGSSLPAGSPGTQGNRQSTDRIVQAMPGESLAQLAQRAGFAPTAWRALADGLANPLKLELGQEVPLPRSSGLGGASGLSSQGQDPGRAAAALPLVNAEAAGSRGGGSNDRSRNSRDVASDPVRQGQAIASRGGLRQAITQTKDQAHQEGAGNSLHGFGLAAAASADLDQRPWGAGVPLRPRFGSSIGDGRRDPTQASWITQPARPAGAGTPPAAGTTAPGRPAKSGCGCRKGRSGR